MAAKQIQARWEEEAAFFDRVAEKTLSELRPIDPLALKRYSAQSLRRRFREEFRFRVVNELRDKKVLDVGCGEGSNSVTLAKLGARVTGIDISPRSIEVAERKAEINGLTESARFLCSPLEEADIPRHSFDVIWGDSILHHLIENLESVMQRLALWAKPGAQMVFVEPTNFNNALRRLRFMMPIKTDATPDERPLEPAEVEIVKQFLPDLQVRFFSLLGRLGRFILTDFNYEHSSSARRALVNVLACTDYALLSLPVIRGMGGYAILYGHTPVSEGDGRSQDLQSHEETFPGNLEGTGKLVA
jgi:2-polyprenyl-3-methyl-5-hydroxy-6-metoxy-1,4-benzoquinol methylase